MIFLERVFTTVIVTLLGLTALPFGAHAQPTWRQTCSGEFVQVGGGFYMIEGCRLSEANARKVMKVCSVGQPCVVTGTMEHCRGVRGACAEMTQVTSMRWGEPLPPCRPTDAATRADQYWSNGSSIAIRGTIIQSQNQKDDGPPPHGHTTIIMDLTTCNTGSPMPVDRVPEKFIGHYVNLKGTAMRGQRGWYIIARQIDDVR